MPKESVKLISKGGYEFVVDYKAACVSNTLKSTLSSDGMHALLIIVSCGLNEHCQHACSFYATSFKLSH
jgi:hypothetical protein